MAKLIDRDALQVWLVKMLTEFDDGNDPREIKREMFHRVLSKVRKMPIVDAAVMKHGKWVHVSGYCTPGGDPVWRCSECGKGIHVYGIEHGTYGADIADRQWVACPNCGAVMDGEEWNE